MFKIFHDRVNIYGFGIPELLWAQAKPRICFYISLFFPFAFWCWCVPRQRREAGPSEPHTFCITLRELRGSEM